MWPSVDTPVLYVQEPNGYFWFTSISVKQFFKDVFLHTEVQTNFPLSFFFVFGSSYFSHSMRINNTMRIIVCIIHHIYLCLHYMIL